KRRAVLANVGWRQLGPNAVHPGGRFLAVGHANFSAHVKVWDLATGEKWVELPDDNDGIDSLSFSADGDTLAAAERPDTAIRIWDVSGLWKARPLKEKLSERDLESLWADLAAEGPKAHRAIWTLAGAPKQAAPWLGRRLRPAVAADEKAIARL